METPTILGHNELLNRVVMERDRMQEVGRVERLWMYPQAHRVMGVICRSGRFRGKRWVYKLPQLDSLGKDTLWVNGAPTETTDEQIRRLESLMDHEVWVDGGDRIGRIVDCLFNRKTGAITQYLLIDGPLKRWVGEPMILSPSEIKGFGNYRVLVDERSLQRLKREYPGLKETWNNLREQAQAEYNQVTEEVQSARQTAAQRAEAMRQQATEQAQTWGQRFSSQAQSWGKRIREQTQELSQEFSEEFKTQASGWREQASELRDQRGNLREQWDELRAGEWGQVPEVAPPDELTWVDEAGDLPPARSPRPQARYPRPEPPLRRPRQEWEGSQDERYGSASYGSESYGSESQPHRGRREPGSRDNPWGYEDQPLPSPPYEPDEPAFERVAPEDSQDDDPWV